MKNYTINFKIIMWVAIVLFTIVLCKTAKSQSNFCVSTLTDLSKTQLTKIDSLHIVYQNEMSALRQQERKATGIIRDGIVMQMNDKCTEHLNDVRSLLTDSQKIIFDTFNNGIGKGDGTGCGFGRGNKRSAINGDTK